MNMEVQRELLINYEYIYHFPCLVGAEFARSLYFRLINKESVATVESKTLMREVCHI